MRRRCCLKLAWVSAALPAGCASGGPPWPPPVPAPLLGALRIHVSYPPTTLAGVGPDGSILRPDSRHVIQSRDSTFIFGTVGRGEASLTVNGNEVPVYPNGGWLAWLPLPDDSLASFSLVAVAGTDTARATLTVPIARMPAAPVGSAWIDATGFSPAGDHWVRPGEGYRVSVRAAPGSLVRALLPNRDTL